MSDPTEPQDPPILDGTDESLPRRSSRAWYLLPIFFLFFGGLLVFVILVNRDPRRARRALILGIILSIPWAVIMVIGLFVDPPEDTDDEIPEVDSDADVRTPVTQHVTISYIDIPDYADEEDVIRSLELAVLAWEHANPHTINLEIKNDAEYDVLIKWKKQIEGNVLGLYRHVVPHTIPDLHFIEIELGHNYCESGYRLHSRAAMTYVFAHEIGHYLGLGHTSKPGHLMYSPEHTPDLEEVIPFDDLGYKIPHLANIPTTC